MISRSSNYTIFCCSSIKIGESVVENSCVVPCWYVIELKLQVFYNWVSFLHHVNVSLMFGESLFHQAKFRFFTLRQVRALATGYLIYYAQWITILFGGLPFQIFVLFFYDRFLWFVYWYDAAVVGVIVVS